MTTAFVLLEDGAMFTGRAIGVNGMCAGELIFNTAMTGYQEVFTDPSYCRQIVTMTAPHIGVPGCNSDDAESDRVHLSGVVMRRLSERASNHRAEWTLADYFRRHRVIAVDGIDTRALTMRVRKHGALRAVIAAGNVSREAAQAELAAFPGLTGMNLADIVSTTKPYIVNDSGETHVVVYDFGVKRQIVRLLVERGARVTVVPSTVDAATIMALRPDGVLLANGPGDPAACTHIIEAITKLLQAQVPLFGICLGMQLLALACGARTGKMPFGHHGVNHPVGDADGRVAITSQNHGFCVTDESLPPTLRITHRSLFDNTIQGIAHTEAPAFGFQGHPEASPGPHDLHQLFDWCTTLREQH